jgi:HEAT repeat protein
MFRQRNNKIWYVIWFVIGISLFISGCPFKSGVEGKAWFRYASEFDQARDIAMANDAAKKGTANEDLAKMDKLKQKFLRAKQPTETEIITVLKSPNRRFQKIGLVAMSLKPIETEQLTEILFGLLQDNDFYFRVDALYALKKFTKFPDSKKVDLRKQLLEIIKNEKAKGILLDEFYLLAKFPSEEAALFLTEQLMKEGKENYLYRNIACNALKRMGDSYYDQAAEYVDKHGSPEIKEELWEREEAWDLYKEK